MSVARDNGSDEVVVDTLNCGYFTIEEQETISTFIALSRTAVPMLIARVEELEQIRIELERQLAEANRREGLGPTIDIART